MNTLQKIDELSWTNQRWLNASIPAHLLLSCANRQTASCCSADANRVSEKTESWWNFRKYQWTVMISAGRCDLYKVLVEYLWKRRISTVASSSASSLSQCRPEPFGGPSFILMCKRTRYFSWTGELQAAAEFTSASASRHQPDAGRLFDVCDFLLTLHLYQCIHTHVYRHINYYVVNKKVWNNSKQILDFRFLKVAAL